jgi:regulator of sigma E protease
MSDFLIAIAAVAVVLGFMILIHEFGHYAVAKLLGVRVEVFSIGFGKRLLGFHKGDTDYRISAIPLGGYVKMSGENPMDERTGDPAEFMSHPRWHRFLIAIAGPAMNILLAIFLLTTVYMVHYEYPAYQDKPAVIEYVKSDSPAARAGILAGDRIVKVDGIENPTWEQLQPREWISPNQPLTVTIQRGDQTFQKTIVPQAVTTSEIGSAGWFPEQPVIVDQVEANTPAARAGLEEGDRIVALDGKPLQAIEAMIDQLQQTKEKPVDLTVIRGTQTLSFRSSPVLSATEDPKQPRYRLGFLNKRDTKVITLPFAQALSLSLEKNKTYSLLILELAKKLVQGKAKLRMVSGPIGIAQDAGYAAQQKGWMPLMELTAGISLNLGIFNLLPIPIMDGGVILFLFIEGLMRRDVSLRIKERVYQAAFVFLVLFAVMVIYNDLMKTLPGLMDRLP